MEKFNEYIKTPEDLQKLASLLKKSEQYLYMLKTGKRNPSLKLAFEIEKKTGGKVPVNSWKN